MTNDTGIREYISHQSNHKIKNILPLSDPPEVTSSQRTVHAWPGGNAHLTCIVRAEPRATVSE